MKIAFLGTKGIPNNYGGFEQFTEFLSVRLAIRGHEVTVYNPSFHPYLRAEFKGVRIKKVFSPEKWVGGAANFLYDHLCLSDALRQDFDILYEAGYHSVAASYKFLGVRKYKKPVILTNMDGLEWRRSKWNPWVQRLIKRLEKIAVTESPYLISDNEGIRQYYLDQYKRDSFYVPYGADPVFDFSQQHLTKYGVGPANYFLLIARMEPENNIELILRSYTDANLASPFLVIGDTSNKFGRSMQQKFSSRVQFLGGIYDKSELDSLRHFSSAYFHGHSVGGTNPSLLEAMACRCFIVSHNNSFNKGVLGEDAIYFSDPDELTRLFPTLNILPTNKQAFQERNFNKIIQLYNWETVTGQHENLFLSLQKQSHSGSR